MILVIIILILCGPALVRSAEDSHRRAEAERRQAERAAELQARQAERIAAAEARRAEAERRQAERAAEAEQKRERAEAAARTMIEFWEPRRRDLIRRIDAEQDARRRERMEAQLFQMEQRLQRAYWTLEKDL